MALRHENHCISPQHKNKITPPLPRRRRRMWSNSFIDISIDVSHLTEMKENRSKTYGQNHVCIDDRNLWREWKSICVPHGTNFSFMCSYRPNRMSLVLNTNYLADSFGISHNFLVILCWFDGTNDNNRARKFCTYKSHWIDWINRLVRRKILCVYSYFIAII